MKPDEIDLVALAMAVLGPTRRRDVFRRALDVLSVADARRHWVLLYRCDRLQYRQLGGRCVGPAEIVGVLLAACGPDARVVDAPPVDSSRPLGRPRWARATSVTRGSQEPDVVIACWGPPRATRVDSAPLQTAVDLIARAARSARVLEYLLQQSVSDPLTGLLNRRGLFEALERESSRASRDGAHLSLIYVDLDRFKEVNDRFGHPVGDEVLAAVARVLHSEVRSSDSVGRIGGDEFVIVLPGTDPVEAREIGARLERRVRSLTVEAGDGKARIGLTYGVAGLDESPCEREMLRRADGRMLRNKPRRGLFRLPLRAAGPR